MGSEMCIRDRRLGTQGSSNEIQQIADHLASHRKQVLAWLESRKFLDLLIVEYPNLLANPAAEIARVIDFVGDDILVDSQAMQNSIRPELYRQRAQLSSDT